MLEQQQPCRAVPGTLMDDNNQARAGSVNRRPRRTRALRARASVTDAPGAGARLFSEQARLREQALNGLHRLADHYAAQGELDQAIACTRRFLVLEPWREEAHRRLMLWRFFPQDVDALMPRGRHLIGSFVPGEALLQWVAAHETMDQDVLKHVESWTEQAGRQGLAGDQERIFEEISDVLEALASQQPLLLLLDDLHWADASSTSLLFHLGLRLRESPVLILGAYRPEEVTLEREGNKHPLADPLNESVRP